VDEDLKPAIDGCRIDDGAVPGNDARLLEIAYAAQTRGRRQPNSVGQVGICKPSIRLQLGQDCAIQLIHGT
jgi:hypothetical protein